MIKKNKKEEKKTGKVRVWKKFGRKTRKRFLKKVRVFWKEKKLLCFLGIVLVLGSAWFGWWLKDLPSSKKLATFDYPESSLIFDRNGKKLYEFYTEINRVPVGLDKIPDDLLRATLAVEDAKFYKHFGFDILGISRAFLKIIQGKRLEGGSTITQQLVKNALLTPERTLSRKVKEAVLTLSTEILYTKDEILEMYFNQTPYGGTVWGAESAARVIFGKKLEDLNLAESAMMAGLPAAPSRYSPFSSPEEAKKRQRVVLSRMVSEEMISQEEADEAIEEKLNFNLSGIQIHAPHFVFWVKGQLVEKYGKKMVSEGGLKITTSLDLDLQEYIEASVSAEIEELEWRKVSNGGVVVTEPKSGQILAMVGSKDYFAEDIDGKYNVTTALRQPGSSIKPLNYATGIEMGTLTAATIFNDIPTCFSVPGQPLYCPTNYDNAYHGPVGLRYALGNSFNIPAVKALKMNTLESFVATASAMGISTFENPDNYGLSLTLGGGEVKMVDMAVAFGTLANMGVRQDLNSILKIENKKGEVIEEYVYVPGERVLSRETSYLIYHIISDDGARAATFGRGSQLTIRGQKVAAKTGTTNDRKDNWTVGFTPSKVVVVWIGNNDNTSMAGIASGSVGASAIWNSAMKKALEGLEVEEPARPVNIVGRQVCNLTGGLVPEGGCETRYELFNKKYLPEVSEPLRQTVVMNKDTGLPVQPGQKAENVEWQDHDIVRDGLETVLCLDCQPTGDDVRGRAAIIN